MFSPAGWLLISALTIISVEGSGDGHIQWHFSSIKETELEWKLVFTASIDRGWHLYSQAIEEGGPMPTSFEFQKSAGFKLLGDVKETGELKEQYDSIFMMDVGWYEKEVVFTQRIKVKSNVKVMGEIVYSVCSEERCIPGSVRFSIDAGL